MVNLYTITFYLLYWWTILSILLKYIFSAVDIWSAGVILLCLLSGRYPIFRAHDDQTAMAQIISLMGSRKCAAAATSCGKKGIVISGISWPLH